MSWDLDLAMVLLTVMACGYDGVIALQVEAVSVCWGILVSSFCLLFDVEQINKFKYMAVIYWVGGPLGWFTQ